jgi:hypothetical protein
MRVVVTCVIRYRVEPGKLAEFREYAHAWIGLIRKYGGTHHGYFLPATDKEYSGPKLQLSRSGHGGSAKRRVRFVQFPQR